MATATNLMTAEEFRDMPDPGQPVELVRGQIIMMSCPGFQHGRLCARLGHRLLNFVEEHYLGYVLSNNAGVVTQRNLDSVRGPDVVFYSFDRVSKQQGDLAGYPEVAPELAFKVLSPTDSWKDVLARVAELLNAGVLVVSVVDPGDRCVTCYFPNQREYLLREADELTFPEVLPGFSLSLKELFAV